MRSPSWSRSTVSTHLRMAVALAACLLVLVPAVLPARAQSPSPSSSPTPGSFCAVLSEAEVSAALYAAFVVKGGGDTACEWDPVPGALGSGLLDDLAFLKVELQYDTFTDITAAIPKGTPESVLGHDAYLTPPFFGTRLYVDVGIPGRVLSLSLLGQALKVDVEAVLVYLAEIVVDRLPTVPLAVPAGDPGLSSLFPKTVGGKRLEVITLLGRDLAKSGGTSVYALLGAFADALAAIGKTMDDVSVGSAHGTARGKDVSIIAVRVVGADAAAVRPAVLAYFLAGYSDPRETALQIAGKAVSAETDGPPRPGAARLYVYTSGDVVWLVTAVEPGLSGVFGSLP